jgi:membrane-bound lytic murein transglycosylase F
MVLAAVAGLCVGGCRAQPPSRLEQIWDAGKIVMVTDNNAHCYYMYRGRPAGFEYELAAAFARHLVVDLEVVTPGWDEMFDYLKSGKGDFIAASLTRLPQREKQVDFSDAYLEIRQHVIAHMKNTALRSIEDLAGKTIAVRSGTSYHQRLLELRQQGLDVRVRLLRNMPTEELIRQVAEQEIELTLADTNVALLNRRYYPDIRMPFAVSALQSLGWAVRKGDTALLKEINAFLAKIMHDGTFQRIFNKYYANIESFDYFDLKTFHRRIEERLPDYQTVILREARRYGFDWRLIAAVIYQESHFDPQAESYTGVRGLMQLTLETADHVGVDDRLDPVQSIAGGVKYLNMLHERFRDVSGFDRTLFMLASYNIGYGHVRDAQRIAREKGLDPSKWNSLRQTLPLLRYPKYYRNTTFGYARGTEPVRYVNRILTYFDILRRRSLTRE